MPKKYLTSKVMKLALVAAVCLGLIFLNPGGFFSPLRGFFLRAAYPFQRIFYLSGHKISSTVDFLGSIADLKEENKRLIKENNYLAGQTAILQGEKKENETLREQLGLIPRSKFDLESSFVIGQDMHGLGSWLLIDKGKSSGIEKGMPAIVSEGILVGKVDEVFETSSRINLLTDSSSSINVVDLETNSKGIVRGEYGLGVVMDMVSQSDVLNPGDTVVTSGLGSNMPKGLMVGRIQDAKITQDKLFQQAIVMPRIKYSKLDVVFVIKK
jgi:rod shape-determining protein MreC